MAYFLFTNAILENRAIDVLNNGKMSHYFTYIDNIVDGVYRVVKQIPESDLAWDGSAPGPSTGN